MSSSDGWQPIETAPEGQWALLSEETGTWMTVAVKRGQDWFEFGGSTHLRNAADLNATHWMPLPEPPSHSPTLGGDEK